jgi:hypothetical protein
MILGFWFIVITPFQSNTFSTTIAIVPTKYPRIYEYGEPFLITRFNIAPRIPTLKSAKYII